MAETLPWARLLGLALTELHWRPIDFWRATPAELNAALEFRASQLRGLDGDDIGALRRRLEERS